MKKITGLLAVAAIVAFVATGCGSSGSNSANTSTTPAATSTTTMNAMSNAAQWMWTSSTDSILGAVGAGAGASKTTSANIQCTGTYADFTCVIWDDEGSATSDDHKCDITGNYDTSLYSFDLTYDCYTFYPSSDVSVDGNWTASIDVATTTATSASKSVYGSKTDSTGDCDIDDISNACGETYTFDGGSCSAYCDGEASCTEAAAMAVVSWTAGSRGVYTTDACGTYNIGAGTASVMAFCQPSASQFIMSSTINGTINGTIIDENIDVDCTLTN